MSSFPWKNTISENSKHSYTTSSANQTFNNATYSTEFRGVASQHAQHVEANYHMGTPGRSYPYLSSRPDITTQTKYFPNSNVQQASYGSQHSSNSKEEEDALERAIQRFLSETTSSSGAKDVAPPPPPPIEPPPPLPPPPPPPPKSPPPERIIAKHNITSNGTAKENDNSKRKRESSTSAKGSDRDMKIKKVETQSEDHEILLENPFDSKKKNVQASRPEGAKITAKEKSTSEGKSESEYSTKKLVAEYIKRKSVLKDLWNKDKLDKDQVIRADVR